MKTADAVQQGKAIRPKVKKSIIDCDVHHYTGLDVTKEYLPKRWLESPPSTVPQGGGHHFNGGVGGRMADSFPPEGGPAGSSLEYMQEHHLDPHHVEYAILTGEGGGANRLQYDYEAAICSATNDYTLEHWLSRDKRLKGSVYITKHEPNVAAQEIDRIGSHPDMVQVLVHNGARLPYGNRFYDPIYQACERHNLPFTIHVGAEGGGVNSTTTGAGDVSYYVESRSARPQVMMAHLASFLFEGTFERFPTLKVLLQEAGVLWVVPYLWKLDQIWMEERIQLPWMKKSPSEYFHEHVRMSTQPFEATPNRQIFDLSMKSMFAEKTLMYCSDYPHWDFDSPMQALPKLDDALWDRVLYYNAAEFYGLPVRRADQGKELHH
ncbi:amidohydrolase family protein [Paenibacillus silviterrae]|uniref:amidohydrolase family protein n=1 Tax=Paenibacillus silviterrae TaxID=3242194 RepID=UPI00254284E3|nr:amidohydrolase family protein [Paenibacillus chinjuensis]